MILRAPRLVWRPGGSDAHGTGSGGWAKLSALARNQEYLKKKSRPSQSVLRCLLSFCLLPGSGRAELLTGHRGECSMSGERRFKKPLRFKINSSAVVVVSFAVLGIAFSAAFAHFDMWTPVQLLAP